MSEKWKIAADTAIRSYHDLIVINSIVIVENDHRLLCFAKGTLYIPKIVMDKEIELLKTYGMYKSSTTGEVEKEAFSGMVRSLLQKIETLKYFDKMQYQKGNDLNLPKDYEFKNPEFITFT